jgi:HlyD family secretion protein
VKQVRLGSQTVQNVVIYTTIISVENPRLELLPGMTATLRVETDVRDNVMRVPNAALRWRPPGAEPVTAQATPSPAPREEAGGGEGPPREGGRRAGGPGGGREMAEFAAALKNELSLTETQQKDVDAILGETRRAIGMLFRSEQDQTARREGVRKHRTEMSARIAALLTAEQRGKFDEMRARFAQNRGQRAALQRGRVYIVNADGKPESVDVRVGVSDGGMTEIVSNKLEAGRDVITGGGPRVAAAAETTQRRGPRFGF